MSGRLSGRVALISGGSRGIGLAIAKAYAREGAKLCLIATQQAPLQPMADALGLPSSDLITAGVDVRNADACHAVVNQVLAHWGRLDVLVNNAGIYKARPFLEYESNDFRGLF